MTQLTPAPASKPRRPSPETARRQLAGRFVRARRDAGHTQASVARQLGWSLRKQQLLESGDQVLAARELDVLLPALEVPAGEWPDWRTLADTAHGRGWWDAFDDEDLSPVAKRFTGLEQGATRIRAFEPLLVPGLLQTTAYRLEVVNALAMMPQPAEQVAALLEVSRRRQELLFGGDPLELTAVLDEAALHRWVGAPDVMREQLDFLADAAGHPNITVQVVPFRAGPHAGLAGSFALMDFGLPGDHGVVKVEAVPDIPTYLESRADLYAYTRVFERLTTLALDPDDSLHMLRDLARRPAGQPREALP